MLTVLLVGFAVLLLLRVPVAITMGLAAIIALWFGADVPLTVVPQRMVASVYSFPLLAVPFFILAGQLMEAGGISKRLVNFAIALVGHVRGSLGIVSVGTSMAFAGISGAATADASAVSSILVPSMTRRGYKPGYSAALIASAAAIGPIIPPSVIMIVYGSISGVSIASMFLAGIVPGLLIGVGLMIYAYLYARKHGHEGDTRASARQVWTTFKRAIWALLAPVIILGGILTGIFSATEAGVVTVLYAFVIGLCYRELKWGQLTEQLVRAALTSTVVLFMISAAGIFGWLLGRQEVPVRAAEWITSLTGSRAVVIALVIVLLLVIGCFMETMAATIILVPVLFPMAAIFGIDPVHWALLICITLTIGGVTPPVGILLYITTSVAKIPLRETIRPVLPMIAILIGVVFLLAYVPELVLFIPNYFAK